MKYIFVDESWEDYLYWQKTEKKLLSRMNDLLKDISRQPYSGNWKTRTTEGISTRVFGREV